MYNMIYISYYGRNPHHGGHNENITLLYHPRGAVAVHLYHGSVYVCATTLARSTRTINLLLYRYTYLLSFSDNLGPGHGVDRGRDVGWSLGGLLHYCYPRSRLFAILLLIIIIAVYLSNRPRVNRLISVFIMHRGRRFIARHIEMYNKQSYY